VDMLYAVIHVHHGTVVNIRFLKHFDLVIFKIFALKIILICTFVL